MMRSLAGREKPMKMEDKEEKREKVVITFSLFLYQKFILTLLCAISKISVYM